MARNTNPPGELGKEARSGLPDQVAGAENGQGITPNMREGRPEVAGLSAGPERGDRGEFLPRAYRSTREKSRFIRVDR